MSIYNTGFLGFGGMPPNVGGMFNYMGVPPNVSGGYAGIPPTARGMLLNAPESTSTPVQQQQPSSAASGVQSAYTVGFPGLSDDEVAAMLGMEYTGDRDQDQMVQDAVEQARNENAIATGTAPSQAEIDQRTAAFEDTMEQLRNNPDMREAWGIDRDTRRFDVGTILRIAASFAIPAISGAIVNALNLSGTVANVTQATLEAAFSSATGGSPGGALISSFGALGDVADAVQTADQARGALDTVQDIVKFIQQVDEYGRRPEDVVEEITTDDQDDLEEDEDLMGTAQVFTEDGDPFFEPSPGQRPQPDAGEIDDVGYEITEPIVTFEQPDQTVVDETSQAATADDSQAATADNSQAATADNSQAATADGCYCR